MKVFIRATVEFTAEIPDDPASYEGATTPEARMAKEREYIESDGECLIDWLNFNEPRKTTATVEPVRD